MIPMPFVQRTAGVLALGVVIAACSSSTRVHGDPIPEDTENPIEIYFTDLTVSDAVGIATRVLSDMAIQARQADRTRGYVETEWLDVNRYEKFAGAYPDRERIVRFYWTFTTDKDGVRKLALSVVYRPNDPARDRMVPLDHPGFSMALRMEEKFKAGLANKGGKLVVDEIR